jgi:hypothetical protein
MKLTKSKLKQLIAEELALEQEEEAAAEPEENLKSDVQTIVKKLKGYIEKIDTYQEYGQLLSIVLKHPVSGKGKVLRKLKDTYLAGMKEQ